MFYAISVAASVAGAAKEESIFQDRCKLAKEIGLTKPKRAKIKREADENGKPRSDWWSLGLAVLIGANL